MMQAISSKHGVPQAVSSYTSAGHLSRRIQSTMQAIIIKHNICFFLSNLLLKLLDNVGGK